MLFPSMTPGMKQFSNLPRLRVDAGEICPFMKITVNASESQIAQLIAAAMNTRNDMLDVELRER